MGSASTKDANKQKHVRNSTVLFIIILVFLASSSSYYPDCGKVAKQYVAELSMLNPQSFVVCFDVFPLPFRLPEEPRAGNVLFNRLLVLRDIDAFAQRVLATYTAPQEVVNGGSVCLVEVEIDLLLIGCRQGFVCTFIHQRPAFAVADSICIACKVASIDVPLFPVALRVASSDTAHAVSVYVLAIRAWIKVKKFFISSLLL